MQPSSSSSSRSQAASASGMASNAATSAASATVATGNQSRTARTASWAGMAGPYRDQVVRRQQSVSRLLTRRYPHRRPRAAVLQLNLGSEGGWHDAVEMVQHRRSW